MVFKIWDIVDEMGWWVLEGSRRRDIDDDGEWKGGGNELCKRDPPKF